MPIPNRKETKTEYINRCIPIVIKDGTAKDGSQAYAVCSSKWDNFSRVDLAAWLRFARWQRNLDSSNIKDMKYDEKTSELTVVFQGGGKYLYSNVPEWLYLEILNHDSIGSSLYWNLVVNPSTYPYKQI